MRKFTVVSAASALTVSMLLGACGASAVSKNTFVAKADDVCATFANSGEAIAAAIRSKGSHPNFADITIYTDQRLANYQSRTNELKTIGYPDGDKATLDAIYTEISDSMAGVKTEFIKIASTEDYLTQTDDDKSAYELAETRLQNASKKLADYGPQKCDNAN